MSDLPTDGGYSADDDDSSIRSAGSRDTDRTPTDSGRSSTEFQNCPQQELCEGTPRSYHRYLHQRGPSRELMIPAPPAERCSDVLQARISNYCESNQHGATLVESIERKTEFRNPSICDKLISHLGIDANGSNFPVEVFDPREPKNLVNYEDLLRKQNEGMERSRRNGKICIQRKPFQNMINTAQLVRKSQPRRKGPLPCAVSIGAARTTPAIRVLPRDSPSPPNDVVGAAGAKPETMDNGSKASSKHKNPIPPDEAPGPSKRFKDSRGHTK